MFELTLTSYLNFQTSTSVPMAWRHAMMSVQNVSMFSAATTANVDLVFDQKRATSSYMNEGPSRGRDASTLTNAAAGVEVTVVPTEQCAATLSAATVARARDRKRRPTVAPSRVRPEHFVTQGNFGIREFPRNNTICESLQILRCPAVVIFPMTSARCSKL